MERYEFRDGSSQKFWEVGIDGSTVTVRFGKIGTNGQSKTKTLASVEAAEKERATLIREKTAKGYVLGGQEPQPASAQSVAMAPEDAVFQECLKQMHAPGLYLAAQQGLQTLSRMGGLPSLPTDVEWPLHLKTKRPLHFLAQVDLGTLPPLGASKSGKAAVPGLPSSGMLFFFIDMGGDLEGGKAGSSPATRVLYTSTTGVDRAAPPGLPQIGHDQGSLTGEYALEATIFEPQVLKPVAVDSYHYVDCLEEDDLDEIDFDDDVGAVKASAKALAKWAGGQAKDYARHLKGADLEQFWETFHEMADESLDDAGSEEFTKSLYAQMGLTSDKSYPTGFQMLGAPIAGFYQVIEARKKGYVSLLSVAGFSLRPSYYDDGVFYFWIKADDLAAARFERAWLVADHS
jgi:predicted DNA-binding WGR domain protein/uncharacterized protein YwqG